MTSQLAGLAPIHPGEILREDVIPGCALSKAEFARRLDMSREALNNILAGKTAITPLTALKLSRLLSTTPDLWLNLQQRYDLAAVSKAKAAQISQVRVLEIA